MPLEEQMEASESTESLPADQESATTDWKAESTRLRQELAKVRQLNRQATPLAQLGYALQNAPGGDAIIEKLVKGEPLTAKETKTVEKASEASGGNGLSLEAIEEVLEKKLTNFERKQLERQRSEVAMQRLHERGKKELPGYEEIYQTPEWNRRLNTILRMAETEEGFVPDEEADPYWYVIQETYATLAKQNPNIGKVKPAKKTESERKGAISKTAGQSAGAPEEDSELAEAIRRAVPARPTTQVGKSLGALRKR